MAKKLINPLQPLLAKIPAPLQNRYVLVAIVFVIWIVFFDKHDVLTQVHLQQTKTQLEEDRVYYHDQTKQIRQDKRDLDLNREKYAREKYFMKQRGEDVFVIVEE